MLLKDRYIIKIFSYYNVIFNVCGTLDLSKTDIICYFTFKLLNLDHNIKNQWTLYCKNKCGHFGRRLYFIFCPYSHMALSLYHFANVILLIHNNGKYLKGPLPQGISIVLNFPGQISFQLEQFVWLFVQLIFLDM